MTVGQRELGVTILVIAYVIFHKCEHPVQQKQTLSADFQVYHLLMEAVDKQPL